MCYFVLAILFHNLDITEIIKQIRKGKGRINVTSKQITALIGTGVIAFSTVLCWPGSFDVSSAFYRAIFINISNMLIAEIPKFKKSSSEALNKIKIFLTILGFILSAVGIMNTSSEEALALGEWIYFWLSAFVCLISIINFIEIMKSSKPKVLQASDYDPSMLKTK